MRLAIVNYTSYYTPHTSVSMRLQGTRSFHGILRMAFLMQGILNPCHLLKL